VVNVGRQDMNAKYFLAVAYTAAWYIGLVNNTLHLLTLLGTHWLLTLVGLKPQTIQVHRPAATFGTATTADPSVIDNSASVAQFSITRHKLLMGLF
jgi:hypothetical protein